MRERNPPEQPFVVGPSDGDGSLTQLAGANTDIGAVNSRCPGGGPGGVPLVAGGVIALRPVAGRRTDATVLAVANVGARMNGEDVAQWLDGTRDGKLHLRIVTKREGRAVWNAICLTLGLQRVVVKRLPRHEDLRWPNASAQPPGPLAETTTLESR